MKLRSASGVYGPLAMHIEKGNSPIVGSALVLVDPREVGDGLRGGIYAEFRNKNGTESGRKIK